MALNLVELSKVVPQLINVLNQPEDHSKAIIEAAKRITGESDAERAIDKIINTPSLHDEISNVVIEKDVEVEMKKLDVELAKIQADVEKTEITSTVENLSDVNKTMQVESKSEHWIQWAWRPTIGLTVAFCAAMTSLITAIAYIGVMFFQLDSKILGEVPGMIGAMVGIVGVLSPILGIASWHRGMEKRETKK
jgi:hypothetical protein